MQASLLQRIPDSWTFQEGAAFLVQGLTAMYGLRSQGNLRCRQTVLVHSAAGGCGQFAMAICNAFGATPIATVGAASKVDYLLERFPWLRREQVIVRDASRYGGVPLCRSQDVSTLCRTILLLSSREICECPLHVGNHQPFIGLTRLQGELMQV